MASSSGTSSVSSTVHNLMDQRKRKRMVSNRGSARRSRMRKQKHLDDVTAQLRKENHHIITSLNITSQHYVNIEAENSVLRAQAAELSNRLHSLDEISLLLMQTKVVALRIQATASTTSVSLVLIVSLTL